MNTRLKQAQEIFEMGGADPSVWADQARGLKSTADILLIEIEKIKSSSMTVQERSNTLIPLIQSYMMLIGFSFENLLKGILIARNPDLIDKDKFKFENELMSHKLVEDLIPADIVLSPREKDLFERLQVFTVWAGRYPFPKKAGLYYTESGQMTLRATDKETIQTLFLRLDKMILEEGL